MAEKWETTKEQTFVNPSCCQTVANSVFCPIFYGSIFGLYTIIAILIAVCCDFYLSDTTEYLEFTDRKFDIWALLFFIGCIIAIIIFAIYWAVCIHKYGLIHTVNVNSGKCKSPIFGSNVKPQVLPTDPYIVRDLKGNIINY